MGNFQTGYWMGALMGFIIVAAIFMLVMSHEGRIVIQKNYANELSVCNQNLLQSQAAIGKACPDVKCSFPSFMYVMSGMLLIAGIGIYIYALRYFNKREENFKKLLDSKDPLKIPMPPVAPVMKSRGGKHGRR